MASESTINWRVRAEVPVPNAKASSTILERLYRTAAGYSLVWLLTDILPKARACWWHFQTLTPMLVAELIS